MSTGPGAGLGARRPVVAVDGPSGSGKSTVSRRLALALGARYLDTGAMYRAVTWAVLQAGVDPHDAETVAKIARPGARCTSAPTRPSHASGVDGVAVDAPIRGREVTAAVSAVSAVPAVRQLLVAQQREIIAGAAAPASWSRAATSARWSRRRRPEGLPDRVGRTSGPAGAAPSTAGRPRRATAADLARRDQLDSTRAADPLAQAADAVVLDTTELGIDEVVARLVAHAARAAAGMTRRVEWLRRDFDLGRVRATVDLGRLGRSSDVDGEADEPARCRWWPWSAGPTSASPPWSTASSAGGRRWSRTCPG